MKIAIFSDCHCGFDYGEARGEDSFRAMEEAFQKSKDADIILLAGDIFDTRIPRPEVFARVAKIIRRAKKYKSNARLVEIDGNDPPIITGTPVVAIHGTHERRMREMVNPVQLLEDTGQIIYLQNSRVVFEIDGKKVAIHGMSGVPERYAKDVLKEWSPKPVPDAINIFVFHQSLEPYIYSPLEPPTLTLNDLPDGFDLYVLGHIHWHDVVRVKSGILLLTGSTCLTSIHKNEAQQKKGIFIYDGKDVNFLPLEYQREVIFEDVQLDEKTNLADVAKRIITNLPHSNLKPILSINLIGKILPSHDINRFEQMLSNYAIVNLKRSESIEESVQRIALESEKISPEESGLKILKEMLEGRKNHLPIEELFELLVEGDTDKATQILLQRAGVEYD